jgi:anti-sigma factor RsiW
MTDMGSEQMTREIEALYAYHDGELSGFARRRFERQLRRSPELQAELALLGGVGGALRELDAEAEAPDLWDRIAMRLPAIDAERAEPTLAPARMGLLALLLRPAGAGLAAALAATALAVAVLWPDASVEGGVVRWVDAGGRSVMVLDDDPGTTIIWVLENGATTGASVGGVDREVV